MRSTWILRLTVLKVAHKMPMNERNAEKHADTAPGFPGRDSGESMTRTRLRGLEIGGIQIGIEVPDVYAWEWPEAPVSEFSCLPREPDVHVGVRVASLSSADLQGDRYGVGAWTFEVARDGDNWLLGLSRRGQREQLATFDADFKVGEILCTQSLAEERVFPLRTPLDEWIVLHRTVLRGGLCLTGRAEASGLHAAIALGVPPSPQAPPPQPHNRWFTPKSALFGRQTVLVREDRGGLRSFRTPWNPQIEAGLGYSARVEKFLVHENSELPYRECLDPNEAAELLLSHSVVPLCDDVFFERALVNARKLADQTPMIRIGGDALETETAAWTLPQVPAEPLRTRTDF